MRRNEYGEILSEVFKKAIELAENIDEVATLRDILEDDFVECSLECSLLLGEKESLYNL
jgi:hypothetical protein